MSEKKPSSNLMNDIINLCKRRGFIFQSSDIYGGYNGFFDYGPLGVELKNNIKQAWWKDMVHRRDDIVGLDSTIIHHPTTWKASGHVDNFTDPLVDCKESKMRYRADQLFFAPVIVAGETIGYVSVLEDESMQAQAEEMAHDMKRKLAKQGEMAPIVLKDYTEAKPEEYALIPSPATGKPGSLTPPRAFNMMFQTYVGALRDETAVAYLRPETAQGIFINFKNIVDTGRVKVPFGIAQTGKAFRNEIVARQFIFRMREFEQMEMQFFVRPGTELEWFKHWKEERLRWHLSLGIPAEKYRYHDHEKLAHYANAATDIEFEVPFGFKELEGIHSRTDFDLSSHSKFSGKKLQYFDPETNESYVPYVIETSIGLDRMFLAMLSHAYTEEKLEDGSERVVMKFPAALAPYKVAILPLVKKDGLPEKAREIMEQLTPDFMCQYEEKDSIGKRYRRQDAIGTPLCVTIDNQTLEDNTVTVRDRDTMEQIRVNADELYTIIRNKIAPKRVG